VRRGHNYLTVVVDLESGQVVWVAEGVGINAIAMDMWPAYIKAVQKYYPKKVIVFDRYHIIQDCNRMLDELRRKEVAKESLKERKEVYTGTRYLLLKGKEKIDNLPEAREKLDRLLALNESLNTAYILKEELRTLWDCPTKEDAEECFNNWLQKAWSSEIELVVKFANQLSRHRKGILNYFDNRITTGQVEGINNKIKALKRQAYGYRDNEYFKLRIYFLHESRYALIGYDPNS
jgi:transposase